MNTKKNLKQFVRTISHQVLKKLMLSSYMRKLKKQMVNKKKSMILLLPLFLKQFPKQNFKH